jgi:hypothetical protein
MTSSLGSHYQAVQARIYVSVLCFTQINTLLVAVTQAPRDNSIRQQLSYICVRLLSHPLSSACPVTRPLSQD